MSVFSEMLKSLGLDKMRDAPPPPEESRLAAVFMKRLKGDRVGPGEAATLEQVLGRAAQAAGVQPGALSGAALKKIADKLIDSLDALVRDEYVKSSDGSFVTDSSGNKLTRRADLDPDVKNKLREIITESGAKNTAELANVLKNFDNNPDPEKSESLFLFLHRGGQVFSVTYAEDEIAMVRQFLNMITPGLGDTVVGILGFNRPAADSNGEKASLEGGFKAMTGGNASLEKVWKPPQKEGSDGRPLPLNLLQSVQPSELEDYFNGTGKFKYGYNFYGEPSGGEKPDLANRGFKETILRRWEETGVVSFANEAARAEFTQFVKQTMMGGALDEGFLATLQEQGKEGLIDFKTPEAQAAFVAFTKTLDAPSLGQKQLAEKITGFVEGRSDMAFKPLDPKFDSNVYGPSTKAAIQKAAHYYVPVKDSREFSERIIAFGKDRQDIKVAGEDAQATKQPPPALRATQGSSTLPSQPSSQPLPQSSSPPPSHDAGNGAETTARRNVLPGQEQKQAIGVYMRVSAEGVSYGAGVAEAKTPADLAALGLKGTFAVHSMDAQGNLTVLGEMTPEQLSRTSFGPLGVQIVMQDGAPIGYFAFDSGRGTGLYLSPEAMDRTAMKDDFRKILSLDYKSEELQNAPRPVSPVAAPLSPGH